VTRQHLACDLRITRFVRADQTDQLQAKEKQEPAEGDEG
jgi:hypothetical protein